MSFNPATVGRETDTVTIANGASLSGAMDMGGHILLGIEMPAAWTVANLTFAVANTLAGTFNPLFDANGNEVTVVAAASEYLQISPSVFAGVRFVKVRSGTSGTPVVQAADRILTLVGRIIA